MRIWAIFKLWQKFLEQGVIANTDKQKKQIKFAEVKFAIMKLCLVFVIIVKF